MFYAVFKPHCCTWLFNVLLLAYHELFKCCMPLIQLVPANQCLMIGWQAQQSLQGGAPVLLVAAATLCDSSRASMIVLISMLITQQHLWQEHLCVSVPASCCHVCMYCFQTHGADISFHRARLYSAQGLNYWVGEAANCFFEAVCSCSCVLCQLRHSERIVFGGSHPVTQTNEKPLPWVRRDVKHVG